MRALVFAVLGASLVIPASAHEVAKIVDREIDTALKGDSITPAPRASDEVLIRRLYLDLLGRIPTRGEVQSFNRDEKPDRIPRLIDALLESDEMPVHWAGVINRWLNPDLPDKSYGQPEFLAFLRDALTRNRPWAEVSRDLLMPPLDDETARGAVFYLASRMEKGDREQKLDNAASAVASGLFGVQLQCAKCHDHPEVDDWTQDTYYGLAAFFSRTQTAKYNNKPALGERADGELTFVTVDKEERTAALAFLDGKTFDEPELPREEKDRYLVPKGKDGKPAIPKFSRRQQLVKHGIEGSGNTFLHRSIVNRTWNELIGRGLVMPIDQMYEGNSASHPKLLDDLASDFASNGTDLRRLIGGILRSHAYQRSSAWSGEAPRPDDRAYAVAKPRALSAEQLAHSILIASGEIDARTAKLEREKQKRKLKEVTMPVVRIEFERSQEFKAFKESFRSTGSRFQANASQALFLNYNQQIAKWLQPVRGNLMERLVKAEDEQAALEEAFLCILSREPTEAEVSTLMELSGSDIPRLEQCGDLVYALFTTPEFRFNH